MTRKEHLEWAKNRAFAYAEKGELRDAWMSMVSDMGKHDETRGHPAIDIGNQLFVTGQLSTMVAMLKFIEGFN